MWKFEKFEIIIKDNNVTEVTRTGTTTDFKGNIKNFTIIRKSKNTKEDTYDKRIGIVVSILKSLGFSRRIIGKISDILLE
jgi:hypothetical protein